MSKPASTARSDGPARPIPGLGPLESFRRFREFRAHPPAFFQALSRRFGDVSAFYALNQRVIVVTDPALVTALLQGTEGAFRKDDVTRSLSNVMGQGLVTSEGALWRRQRKLLAPPLQRKHIALYADAMARRTDAWLAPIKDGQVVDIHEEMSTLTLGIVVETLFGDELPPGSEDIGAAIDDVMSGFEKAVRSLYRYVPAWVPTGPRRKVQDARQRIDRCVYAIIEDKRRRGAGGDDIISRMLAARDDEGHAMDDRQLRDEAVTMFIAGHETTSNALVWTLYLLAQRPDMVERVRDEVQRTLGERLPGAEDAAALPFTRAVLEESMRLYPPVYVIGREAAAPTRLGPYQVHPGEPLLIPTWVLQRDPRYFERPEEFWPERWLDGLAERLPRHVYAPFGGGPRVCIGNHFAMMEATILLAQIIREVTPRLVSPEPVALQFAVTMRPRHGLALRLRRD